MSQRQQAPDIESAQLLPRDNDTILTIKNYGSFCRRSWWCVPTYFCCRGNCLLGIIAMKRQVNSDEYNALSTCYAALEEYTLELGHKVALLTCRMEKLEGALIKERRLI